MPSMALYVQPQSGINVGRIVRQVLHEMDWSPKVAAMHVRESYEPTLSRGLTGLGPLDMHALACFPAKFWWKVGRRMIAAAMRRDEHQQQQERIGA